MTTLDHNTIPLAQTDQDADRVLVEAYGDGSAVWLGFASDAPDVLNYADLEPQEARRLAFRLFVAADAAVERAADDLARELTVDLALDPQGAEVISADAPNAPAVAALREWFVGPSQEYVPLAHDTGLEAPHVVQTADHEYALLCDDKDFEPATVPGGPIVQIRRGYLYGKIAEASADAATAAKLIDALEQTRPARVCIGTFVFGYGALDTPSLPTSELPDDTVCCPLQHLAKLEHVEFPFMLPEADTFDFVKFDRLMGKQEHTSHVCAVID